MNKLALTVPGFEPINPPGGIPQGSSISNIIQFGIASLLVISAILAFFFLIYGGIRWISSGGDKEAVEGARKTVTYAIIGLAIVLGSFFILNTIYGFFGLRLTNYTCVGQTRGTCPVGFSCNFNTGSGYQCEPSRAR